MVGFQPATHYNRYIILAVALIHLVLGVRVGTATAQGLPDDAPITYEDRVALREEVRDLFHHAYDSYMTHAFPRDVLRPLSCRGDDGWGNMSLTLLDTLDMLALLNNASEFSRAVRWCTEHVRFDVNKTVSLFETNIRALGGLISAHLLAEDETLNLMPEYDGGLLRLAVDLADRLMPAFATKSGIPFGSVNLRYGVAADEARVTCTAAAGSLTLEFGALSVLTGDAKYEAVARRAALAVWRYRSRHDLMGAHIDIRSGAWTQADAGVGRGIDSFYEYMLKAHLIFGDSDYLAIFHDAYYAALRHLKQGSWYVDVHTTTAQVTWPLFNSLQCFWPGMQMLLGEVELAVDTLRAFHSLWRHLGFHPEGYSLPTLEVKAGQTGYPLRPEHVESLFWTHRALGGDEWLRAGRDVLRSLQRLRVDCGVAALKDVTTGEQEDVMESFFLSETAKYLFLLFDPDDEVYSHGDYVFTTEAHPLPADLAVRFDANRMRLHDRGARPIRRARSRSGESAPVREPLSAQNADAHGLLVQGDDVGADLDGAAAEVATEGDDDVNDAVELDAHQVHDELEAAVLQFGPDDDEEEAASWRAHAAASAVAASHGVSEAWDGVSDALDEAMAHEIAVAAAGAAASATASRVARNGGARSTHAADGQSAHSSGAHAEDGGDGDGVLVEPTVFGMCALRTGRQRQRQYGLEPVGSNTQSELVRVLESNGKQKRAPKPPNGKGASRSSVRREEAGAAQGIFFETLAMRRPDLTDTLAAVHAKLVGEEMVVASEGLEELGERGEASGSRRASAGVAAQNAAQGRGEHVMHAEGDGGQRMAIVMRSSAPDEDEIGGDEEEKDEGSGYDGADDDVGLADGHANLVRRIQAITDLAGSRRIEEPVAEFAQLAGAGTTQSVGVELAGGDGGADAASGVRFVHMQEVRVGPAGIVRIASADASLASADPSLAPTDVAPVALQLGGGHATSDELSPTAVQRENAQQTAGDADLHAVPEGISAGSDRLPLRGGARLQSRADAAAEADPQPADAGGVEFAQSPAHADEEASREVGGDASAAGAAAQRSAEVDAPAVHSASGARLAVGMRVRVSSSLSSSLVAATVRFLGSTHFKHGVWVGVRLDAAVGKNDGAVLGVRYFSCEPKHGLFVRPTHVHAVETDATSRVVAQPKQGRDAGGAELSGGDDHGESRVRQTRVRDTDNDYDDDDSGIQRRAAMQGGREGERARGPDVGTSVKKRDSPSPSPSQPMRVRVGEAAAQPVASAATSTFGSSADDASAAHNPISVGVIFGLGQPESGVALSPVFPHLARSEPGTPRVQRATHATTLVPNAQEQGLLQRLFGGVSSSLQFLLNGQDKDEQQMGKRPRLGDRVEVLDAGAEVSAWRGLAGVVVHDDKDAQPYRVQFDSGDIVGYFKPSQVRLLELGVRPFVGDRVFVTKDGDARGGEAAVVIQDDADAQPFRLRFSDGALSKVFYREGEVLLAQEERNKRVAVMAAMREAEARAIADSGGRDGAGLSADPIATSIAEPNSASRVGSDADALGGGEDASGTGTCASPD